MGCSLSRAREQRKAGWRGCERDTSFTCALKIVFQHHILSPFQTGFPKLSRDSHRAKSITHPSPHTWRMLKRVCRGFIKAWDAHCKHICPHLCKLTMDQSHMQPGFDCWPEKQALPQGFYCILSCANLAFTTLTSQSQDSDVHNAHQSTNENPKHLQVLQINSWGNVVTNPSSKGVMSQLRLTPHDIFTPHKWMIHPSSCCGKYSPFPHWFDVTIHF